MAMKARGTLVLAAVVMSVSLAWGEDTVTTAPVVAPPTVAISPVIVIPTMAEIKAMMDESKWNDALKGISRAIPPAKRKEAGYDEYTLHMLSGECQLQLRNNFTAISEYEQAFKLAKSKEDQAVAFASKTLVEKRDSKWRYVPNGKNGDKDGIDLLDRAKREEAIKALSSDVLNDVRAASRKAQGDRALPPLVKLANSLGDARIIVYAATRSEDDIEAVLKDLAAHAQTSIGAAINDMQRQIDDIGRRANELVRIQQPIPNTNQTRQVDARRGLSGNDAQVLNNNINTLRAIPNAINDLRKTFGDRANFNNQVNDANRLADRANTILRDDYTRR
jgi:hypothetical protein